jgi:hypothetical protein
MRYGRHDSTTTLITCVEPLEAWIAFNQKPHIVINNKVSKSFQNPWKFIIIFHMDTCSYLVVPIVSFLFKITKLLQQDIMHVTPWTFNIICSQIYYGGF